MYRSIVPTGSEQPIYDAVLAAVHAQRLAPGTKLVEARLAELFGVSRTIVRMALLRLAHDHVVELQPNRGASIASPGVDETRMVFEARRLVECAAMPLVAKRASRRSLAGLRTLVRREDAAFQAGDIREWIRLSGEFHVRVVALSANAAVLRFASELVTRSLLMTALYMPSGQTSCAAGDHRALLEALASGDAAKAARMMHDHLTEREARLDLRGGEARPVELAVALGFPSRVA